LGRISNFNSNTWIEFDLSAKGLKGRIGEIDIAINSKEMPFIYSAGLLRFQTFRARSILSSLAVESVPA